MENENKQLADAISFASSAHKGQFDKGGDPYILHPLHLMNQLLWDKTLAAIAVMHDVVEDSDITLEILESVGFSQRIVSALDCLTHRDGESYNDYIERICTNKDAITVKRKDLEHNSDITRLKGVSAKDLARMEKYHKSFLKLGEARRKFHD